MHAIMPGRRALGEEWSKVTIYATPEGGYVSEREDTAAPAMNQPIFVPALGSMSYEAVDYLLEHKRKDQEYRKAHGLSTPKYTQKDFEKLFYDWMELKMKRFKGQTQSGPDSWVQRAKGE
jgi:hypothetical protein